MKARKTNEALKLTEQRHQAKDKCSKAEILIIEISITMGHPYTCLPEINNSSELFIQPCMIQSATLKYA